MSTGQPSSMESIDMKSPRRDITTSPTTIAASLSIDNEPAQATSLITLSAVDEPQHASGVTIVDDTIVEPRASAETASDHSHAAPPQGTIEQSLNAESPQDESAHGESAHEMHGDTVTSEAASVSTPSIMTSLPAAVDLQKLLSSFTTPIVASEDRAHAAQAEPARSAFPVPPDTTKVAPVPTVPWQSQIAPSAPRTSQSSGDLPSDDALYEQFLVDEKRIMGNTAPHEFEPGSRLFVGNMSIETTSKRQVYFIFRKYGKLAQVSLKTTYGFVQFLSSRECRAAVDGEQGLDMGGKKLHLEVCKPQPVRGASASQSRRRSRSPVRRTSAQAYGREPYDPYGRSPPPRRPSPGRFHMPHEPHYPARRSPSPRRAPPANDFPLPQRYGAQIPDVQIVVLDEADRSYISWVESAVRQSGLKVETLFLSPRLDLPAVVRQMVKEGVLAIIECNRQLQMVNKVSLQVFDRSNGSTSVRFDEYAALDMSTAIGLLKRTQQVAAASAAMAATPVAPPQQANLAAMIAQMDPASLQQVIGALSQQQQHQQPSNPPNARYSGPSYPYRR